MALSIPSTGSVYAFWGPEANTDSDPRMTLMIQMAADLVWMATGIDADPVDARQNRFVQYAVMDMAIYLYANRLAVSEVYSGNTSVTIGSYSYNKSLVRDALEGKTGVQFFDLLVNAILLGVWSTQGWSSSEDVFIGVYRANVRSERLLHPADARISGPSDGNMLSDFNSTLDADPVNVSFPFGGD